MTNHKKIYNTTLWHNYPLAWGIGLIMMLIGLSVCSTKYSLVIWQGYWDGDELARKPRRSECAQPSNARNGSGLVYYNSLMSLWNTSPNSINNEVWAAGQHIVKLLTTSQTEFIIDCLDGSGHAVQRNFINSKQTWQQYLILTWSHCRPHNVSV